MPSKNPVIALRLEPALYARVEAISAQQGRSLSNFVAQHLRLALASTPGVSSGKQADLVDGLATAIAKTVAAGPRGRAKKHK